MILKSWLSYSQQTHSGTPLGKGFFKIRLAIGSKGRGKSGGARVISHIDVTISHDKKSQGSIYLVTIYDKSEMSTITDADLKLFLKEINDGLKF
jgi:hypothetical protein